MENHRELTVLIVEDHKLTNQCLMIGLEKYPQFNVVGQGFNGLEGLELAQKHQPDIVLMDICMPELNGIETTQAIKKEFPGIKVIMTTSMMDKQSVTGAFAAQADGYCTKETELEELVNIIPMVAQGNPWIDPKIARFVIEELMGRSSTNSLPTTQTTQADTSPKRTSSPENPVQISSTTPLMEAQSVKDEPLPSLEEEDEIESTADPVSETTADISMPVSETSPTVDKASEKETTQTTLSQASAFSALEQAPPVDFNIWDRPDINESLKELSPLKAESPVVDNPDVNIQATGFWVPVQEALNNRELEILKLIADNKSNEDIGKETGLAPNWIKGYVENIIKKLSVSNEIQAVRRALDDGFIKDAPVLDPQSI